MANPQADREIVLSRILDAPRELVFKVWTDSEHLKNWWGPTGFSITTHELEFKPGGVWRFMMHGPDGVDYPNRIEYTEIRPPGLIRMGHYGEGEFAHIFFEAEITFEDVAGRTKLTMRNIFPTAAERDQSIRDHGAIEGGRQTLQRLAMYLVGESGGWGDLLVMERKVAAPRELVFKMWTEAEHFAQWCVPNGFTNPVCKLDARPEGKIYVEMQGPDGELFPYEGQFIEVNRPERIVFVAIPLDGAGQRLFEELTVVTLFAEGASTKLIVEVSVTNVRAEGEIYLAGMDQGWTETLDNCIKYIAGL